MNWSSLPGEIKKHIINMNPSFKEIHSCNMEKTISEINSRRRDFSCVTCTRMTIFGSKPVYRKPSVRLFATYHPYTNSSIVRVCGECKKHRTSVVNGVKFEIPRKYEHDKDLLIGYILDNTDCNNLILQHYGLDENDVLIRLSVLDGNIVNLYPDNRRPRWSILKAI